MWMLAASLGFAVMGVFVKLGAPYFSAAEMVFWRSLLSMIAAAVLLWRAGTRIRTSRIGMHAHRALHVLHAGRGVIGHFPGVGVVPPAPESRSVA